MKRRDKRGYGLIEVILAISMGLGLTVGGVTLFQQTTTSATASDAGRDLISIASEVRTIYATRRNFEGLTTQDMIDMKAIRPDMVSMDGSERIAVISGEGRLEYTSYGASNEKFQVTVVFPEVSDFTQRICNRLIASNEQGGVGPLGNGYTILSSDCNDPSSVSFSVVYSSDGGRPTL